MHPLEVIWEAMEWFVLAPGRECLVSLQFISIPWWVVTWQFVLYLSSLFVYIVGLCLGSLFVYIVVLCLGSLYCILTVCFCTLLGCNLAVCLCTLLGCVLAACLCTLLCCNLAVCLCTLLGYHGSLSIGAQLRMQCCNVVLRNVTACLGLHKTMYEVSVSFSSFVTCASRYNVIYILHSLFVCWKQCDVQNANILFPGRS
jgi:hypothetical protein